MLKYSLSNSFFREYFAIRLAKVVVLSQYPNFRYDAPNIKQVIEESQTAAAVIVTAAEDAALNANDDAIMMAAGNVKEEAITDERDDGNEGGKLENS